MQTTAATNVDLAKYTLNVSRTAEDIVETKHLEHVLPKGFAIVDAIAFAAWFKDEEKGGAFEGKSVTGQPDAKVCSALQVKLRKNCKNDSF